jgi:hypothetical protein
VGSRNVTHLLSPVPKLEKERHDAHFRRPFSSNTSDQLITKSVFSNQFVPVVVWPTVPANEHSLTRTTPANTQREFADEFSIHQAPTFPTVVQSFSVLNIHALLHDEGITGVSPPLFVERSDTTAAAIGNHITNPLRI